MTFTAFEAIGIGLVNLTAESRFISWLLDLAFITAGYELDQERLFVKLLN